MATEKQEVETEKRDEASQERTLEELIKELLHCSKNTQTEGSADSQEDDLYSGSEKESDEGPVNYSEYYFWPLVTVIQNCETPENVEASKRELHRRWEAYKAWKEKKVPEEDRHKILKPYQKFHVLCLNKDSSLPSLWDIAIAANTEHGESEC